MQKTSLSCFAESKLPALAHELYHYFGKTLINSWIKAPAECLTKYAGVL